MRNARVVMPISPFSVHSDTTRHDEIRDKLVAFASKGLTPSAAHNEPLIHSRANDNAKTLPTKTTNQNIDKEAATGDDERGDLLF